jgi:CelD/BcsL family acetyltransferase involved in cellulose biosynthesis
MNANSLSIEKINAIDALEPIKPVWNSLLEISDTKTIELTYEWQMDFWQQFNQGAELFILIVRKAGSITAIAPLKLITKRFLGIKVRTLEIIAARTSNYQDLVIGNNSEEVMACILDYLVTNRAAWDRLNLMHIPENSITAGFFSKLTGNRPFFTISETDPCATLALDVSWEEHKASLGKHRRHVMKNRMVRLEKDLGEIQIKKSLTQDQLQENLQVFYDSHRKRWDKTSTPSIFWDPRYCTFYSEAGSQLLSKGQLGLYFLEAGGIPLAHLIFFTFGKTILLQLITYDPNYYQYSPTVVLIERFIDEAMANGAKEIDFGTYYPWKEQWVNKSKNKLSMLFFPRRFLPSMYYAFNWLFQTFRSKIRQQPRFLEMIKKTLRSLRILKWFSSQATE